MGVDVWVRREPAAPEPVTAEPMPVEAGAAAPAVSEPVAAPAPPVHPAKRSDEGPSAPAPLVGESASVETGGPAPATPEPLAVAAQVPVEAGNAPGPQADAPQPATQEQSSPSDPEAPPQWLFEAGPESPPEWLSEPELPSAVPEPAPALDWPGLRSAVGECSRCAELVNNRTQSVFGVGDQNADWLIIGEAPGADEDKKGEPFVGRAGQLLNNMLGAIGLARGRVYIANILKCRPPNNRDPRPEEAEACGPFLQRQIELIRPRIILVVGRIAAQNLLDTDKPLGRLRGSVHRHGPTGTPVVVTYHPAYLLRSPQDKRKAWDDLRLALRTADEGAGNESQ